LRSFPKKIVHFWSETNLPSRNFTILSGSLLGSKIVQFCQSTLLVGIEQFSLAVLLNPKFGQVVIQQNDLLINSEEKYMMIEENTTIIGLDSTLTLVAH